MEVMVAVVIVSIVIAALLQLQGNTTHKFFGIKDMMRINQYNSFLLSVSDKYGFESSNIDMKRLVDEFELESDLRRRLKSMKLKVEYEELISRDMSKFDDSAESDEESENSSSSLVFEIGKTSLSTKEFNTHLIRVRIQ